MHAFGRVASASYRVKIFPRRAIDKRPMSF